MKDKFHFIFSLLFFAGFFSSCHHLFSLAFYPLEISLLGLEKVVLYEKRSDSG